MGNLPVLLGNSLRTMRQNLFSTRVLMSLPWRAIFLLCLVTAGLMTIYGVGMRLSGEIPAGILSLVFGIELWTATGLTAGQIGWMLVLEGTLWIGALAALGVGNYWGWWSTAAAGLIALIFFPVGTLAGIILLGALGIRLIRAYFGKRLRKQQV
jgi:hypothetical protein